METGKEEFHDALDVGSNRILASVNRSLKNNDAEHYLRQAFKPGASHTVMTVPLCFPKQAI